MLFIFIHEAQLIQAWQCEPFISVINASSCISKGDVMNCIEKKEGKSAPFQTLPFIRFS